MEITTGDMRIILLQRYPLYYVPCLSGFESTESMCCFFVVTCNMTKNLLLYVFAGMPSVQTPWALTGL